jgi:hypothetical protein
MAIAYEKYGACNLICVAQSSAAEDVFTLSGAVVNGGNAYTILGAYVNTVARAAGSRVDITIGGVNIGTQLNNGAAVGFYQYNLSDTFANLQVPASEDVVITITNATSLVQVQLLISGFTPTDG